MRKIIALADAYASHCVIAGFICDNKARAALQAEVEKLEAAFNDRVRVIEMQLQDKEALQAEVDEQREDYLAKCSELEAVHEHYRIITVKLQAELEEARKDADRYRWWVGAVVAQDFDALEKAFEHIPHDIETTKVAIDAVIDAAMEATK